MDGWMWIAVVLVTLEVCVLVSMAFDWWYDRVKASVWQYSTMIWLPRDITVEDLKDMGTWRSERTGRW